jgi:transcriptional regulator with XRE-family HTH domain
MILLIPQLLNADMKPNERLLAFRLRTGLSRAKIAEQLGINEPWYWDLETYPDELAATLDVAQLCLLARLLNIRPGLFFSDLPSDSIDPAMLASALQANMQTSKETQDQVSDRIGWKIDEFLADPLRVAQTCNGDFLRDACSGVGLDWIAVLEGCCKGTEPSGLA